MPSSACKTKRIKRVPALFETLSRLLPIQFEYHCVGIGGPGLGRGFFFNDTATTEIYTLSLHDALPIWCIRCSLARTRPGTGPALSPAAAPSGSAAADPDRSEEHTSELQSQFHLVC